MGFNFEDFKEKLSNKGGNIAANGLRKCFKAFGGVMSSITPAPVIEPAKFDYIPAAKAEKFTVGFGKETVLPPDFLKKTYYVAGYNDSNPAIGCLDEPHAHAVWIDDNSGRGGILLVSIDTVGLLSYDVTRIRAYLSDFTKATGCRNISIMSTHNHASIDTMGNWGKLPRSGRDKEYMKFFYEQVRKAAVKAYEDRRDGDLYLGSVEVPDMQEDIRTPIVYSKTLTRVRFVPDDGSRQVFLVNFASHSESLQSRNSRVSADFPGYFREAILEDCGAETAYFVGAIGGMISMLIENEREIKDAGGDFAESTKNIGRKLAGYALSIKDEKKLSPCINFVRQEFYVELENTILMMAKILNIIKSDPSFVKKSTLGVALKTELTYLELGELHIVMLPGELFPELAYGGYLTAEESATGFGAEVNPTPLLEIAGDSDIVFFGLSNDEIGYVLPPNDFMLHPERPYFDSIRDRHNRKHYEETNSVGPKAAQGIADAFALVMDTVKKAKA